MKHARKDYDRIQDPENKIPTDEPVFLLRGQDASAARTVRYWATQQPKGSKVKRLALNQAKRLDDWKKKKVADL